MTKLIENLSLRADKDRLKNIFDFDLINRRNLTFDRNESQLEKLGITNRIKYLDHYFENNFNNVFL